MKSNYENRFIAYIIDYSIFLALSFFIVIQYHLSFNQLLTLFNTAQILTFLLLTIYKLLCYTLFKGVTIGGFLCNIRIVNQDFKPLTIRTAFIRALLHSLLPLAIINVAYMLLNRTQHTIFDVATNTTAVNLFESN